MLVRLHEEPRFGLLELGCQRAVGRHVRLHAFLSRYEGLGR